MRQLRVALVCRDGPRSREARMIGEWSYPVAEFRWDVLTVPRFFRLDRAGLAAEGYDMVVHEDSKAWGEWTGEARLPVAYIVRDSTLSEDHYQRRREQAARSDLVLVDWDRLERFADLGVPVRRLSHSVNEQLFRDYAEGKTVDVAFHIACKGCPERAELREWLREFCARQGYSYTSGVLLGEAYPRALSRARVTVNLERTPTTRAHRLFDAMACRTCVLTSPEPVVSGEERLAGRHYREFVGYEELARRLSWVLDTGGWQEVADAGYELVRRAHTWQVRARQLRQVLAEVFPWLS